MTEAGVVPNTDTEVTILQPPSRADRRKKAKSEVWNENAWNKRQKKIKEKARRRRRRKGI